MLFVNLARRHPFPLAIDIQDRKRPEGNQIYARYEFSREGRKEFPVPAQKPHQDSRDYQIEDIIGRRKCAFRKQRHDKKLKRICSHRQDHGDLKAPAIRDRSCNLGIDTGVHNLLMQLPSLASLDFFVWRPTRPRQVLWPDLLDIELCRSLAHGFEHLFERRRFILDPPQRINPCHNE